MGILHEDQYTFLSYLVHFFLEWDMFQRVVVKKIRTYVLCSLTFFSFPKIVPFKTLQSRGAHKWQYGASALHAVKLRLQSHSEYVILLLSPQRAQLPYCRQTLHLPWHRMKSAIFRTLTKGQQCNNVNHAGISLLQFYPNLKELWQSMSGF
jgi:hypothetical protein